MNDVPYAVFEGSQIRHERTVKRLIIALIVAVILIFASNAIWLYAWCQYDYEGDTQSQVTVDAKDGVANYVGNNGDITNGKDNSSDKEETDTP